MIGSSKTARTDEWPLTAFDFKPLRGTPLHLSRGHYRRVELVHATWKRH